MAMELEDRVRFLENLAKHRQTAAGSPTVTDVPVREYLESLIVSGEARLDQRLKDLIARVEQRITDAETRNTELFRLQSESVDVAISFREKSVNDAMTASAKAIEAAMLSSEKAVLKAESATDTRFNSVNEFRQSLNDVIVRLIPRAEAEERFKALTDKVEAASKAMGDRLDALAKNLSDKMDSLTVRIAMSEGTGVGKKENWTFIFGAMGMLLGVVGILSFINRMK